MKEKEIINKIACLICDNGGCKDKIPHAETILCLYYLEEADKVLNILKKYGYRLVDPEKLTVISKADWENAYAELPANKQKCGDCRELIAGLQLSHTKKQLDLQEK